MDMIKVNPEWWVVVILDGFKSHFAKAGPLKLFLEAKILLAREEAGSSHVNQAYDQQVAKSDKAAVSDAVALHRQSGAGTVDQWDLLTLCLSAVRKTNENPAYWRNSFGK